jgi:dethiobiotin synthetase
VTAYVLVTGTDTGVGKTVTTAVLALRHQRTGQRVTVVKPVQTGVVAGEPGDAAVVAHLAGADAHEYVRLPEPLAPHQAAARAGVALPGVDTCARRISDVDADVVLVEGAGGVTVALDDVGGTLLELGRALTGYGDVQVVVVCRSGLGTLNHTQLTVQAVRAAGLPVAGLVIGSWPEPAPLVDRLNREDLPRVTGAPLLAVLPAGLGQAAPAYVRGTDW